MNLITRQEAADYLTDASGGADTDLVGQLITHISRRLAIYTCRADWGGQASRTEYYSGGSDYLVLNYAPLVSITAIYEDESDHEWGTGTDIDTDNYFALTTTLDAHNLGIVHAEGGVFAAGFENLKITYTGGYSGVGDIPGDLKTACLLQLEYDALRRNAGRFISPGEPTGLLPEVRQLADKYRRLLHRV